MENLTDVGAVRSLLDRYGFRFSKALGQNFLINPTVCPRMAEVSGVGPASGVLEIGPGIGVLTRELATRASKVVAVELDQRLLPVLEETLRDAGRVKVVHGDVMKLDLAALLKEEFRDMPVAVCANLPYYITSPIIMGLLESRLPFTTITVLVQKEAAQRLCARPGSRECGAVTLAVQYYAEAKILFPVSRGSFLPAPKVDSVVMQLQIRREPPCRVKDEACLFRLIRAAFGQRRKTLANSLTGAGLSKTEAEAALRAAGMDPGLRAEQLTLEQFAALADRVTEGAGKSAPEEVPGA